MNVSFELSFRDHYRAALAIHMRSSYMKIQNWILIYLPAAVLAIGVVLVVLGISLPIDLFGIAFVVLALGLWFKYVFPRLFVRLQVYLFRKNNPSVEGRQSFDFTSDRIRMAGPEYTTDLQWSALHEIVETPEYFFFYFGRNVAYTLPKRAVGRAELPELRNLIQSCAPERAELLTVVAADTPVFDKYKRT